jgi:hypothetical protein
LHRSSSIFRDSFSFIKMSDSSPNILLKFRRAVLSSSVCRSRSSNVSILSCFFRNSPCNQVFSLFNFLTSKLSVQIICIEFYVGEYWCNNELNNKSDSFTSYRLLKLVIRLSTIIIISHNARLWYLDVRIPFNNFWRNCSTIRLRESTTIRLEGSMAGWGTGW